jgi:hypothetical protein
MLAVNFRRIIAALKRYDCNWNHFNDILEDRHRSGNLEFPETASCDQNPGNDIIAWFSAVSR